MQLVTRALRPGAKVVDRDAKVTREDARQIKASGADAIGRVLTHISRPDQDLDRQELEDICAEGLGVFVYDQYLHDKPFNADTGKERGENFANRLKSVVPECYREVSGFGDLESSVATNEGGLAFLNAWNAASIAIRGVADQYLSRLGFSLSRAQLDASGTRQWWRSGAKPDENPSNDYVLVQAPGQSKIGDIVIDNDVTQKDANQQSLICIFAANDQTAPSEGPIVVVDPNTFVFVLKYDESIGDRRARWHEELLADGPCGHTLRPTWYASAVNVAKPPGYMGGKPVTTVASWSTSCLIVQEACNNACGRTPMRSPSNAEGFFAVFDPSQLVKLSSGRLPGRGDVVYVADTGYDGHVVTVLQANVKKSENGTWIGNYVVAGGGGGPDGTQASIGTWDCDPKTGAPQDPPQPRGLSRAYQGFWPADCKSFALPPSPKAPPLPNTTPAPTTDPGTKTEPVEPTKTTEQPTTPTQQSPKKPLDLHGLIATIGSVLSSVGVVVTSVDNYFREHPAALVLVIVAACFAIAAIVFFLVDKRRKKNV